MSFDDIDSWVHESKLSKHMTIISFSIYFRRLSGAAAGCGLVCFGLLLRGISIWIPCRIFCLWSAMGEHIQHMQLLLDSDVLPCIHIDPVPMVTSAVTNGSAQIERHTGYPDDGTRFHGLIPYWRYRVQMDQSLALRRRPLALRCTQLKLLRVLVRSQYWSASRKIGGANGNGVIDWSSVLYAVPMFHVVIQQVGT